MLDLVASHSRERDHPPIFVNLGSASFDDEKIHEVLTEMLLATDRPALGIEITEHTALRHSGRTAEKLTTLRELGALVAIDDFGVGFLSFPHLASLPCDIVKIPKSISSMVLADGPSDAVTHAVTTVAHAMGKAVVVEGVETPEAARRAKAMGVEYAQGWHLGKPAQSSRPQRYSALTLG
jgi:EAL domain-containing protein (putative c-di-GMP-specific phosphodiesterase class I)